MRIYKITADCLVDFCTLNWYVKAKNEADAWIKGWLLVHKSPVADEGSVDCKRVKIEHSVKLNEVFEYE